MRSVEDITREVKALRFLLARLVPNSSEHHLLAAAIEAQIDVLEQDADDYDIQEEYGESSFIYAKAMDAFNWALGDSTIVPSEDWAEYFNNKH